MVAIPTQWRCQRWRTFATTAPYDNRRGKPFNTMNPRPQQPLPTEFRLLVEDYVESPDKEIRALGDIAKLIAACSMPEADFEGVITEPRAC
jgi:hypothetical protein